MTAHPTTARDPRDAAFTTAPDRLKGALVSLLAAVHEILDDPASAGQVLEGVVMVLQRRLSRDEIGVLHLALLWAAHPDDFATLEKALRQQFYGPTGAPVGSRYRPRQLTAEERRRAESIPPFDLPADEFGAMMCANSAPLAARKRAVIRLLDSFDDSTKRACATWLLEHLETRRAA